jgi:hypothetical protein
MRRAAIRSAAFVDEVLTLKFGNQKSAPMTKIERHTSFDDSPVVIGALLIADMKHEHTPLRSRVSDARR